EREFLMVFEALEEKTTVPVSEMQNPENEGISDVDRMISNIVRNLANPDNPVIDPREYQDRVKEEMIQKGLLGEDNFIDDWKRNETEQEAVVIAERVRQEMQKAAEEDPPLNYQGPTRVYYRLENRYHRTLPIPVYKCEGGGKVTLSIEVDPTGIVLTARVLSAESTTTDQCLLETAVKSAYASRFNRNPNSPSRQQGTLTYHFVAQ
ncbi:MAG: hypothetical protein RBS37_13250, partial [Bacteroidales bacterium]|nr:hypothetical protein [Bacteroidales bacterium]